MLPTPTRAMRTPWRPASRNAVENRGMQDLIHRGQHSHGDCHRDHGQRPQDRGAQGIPRLCAGQDGYDRRDLASGAQHPRRHRLCGLGQQGHPPHRRRDRRPGRGKARGSGALSTWATTSRSPTAPWSPSWAPWRRSIWTAGKVRVVVSMFGRETPVELELDQVEPVD